MDPGPMGPTRSAPLSLPSIPGSKMAELTGKIHEIDRCPFGRGGQGDIFKGNLSQGDGRIVVVAIKAIRPTALFSDKADVAFTKKAQDKLVREGMIWSSLKHPNVVPFFGVCYDLIFPGVPCFIIPYYRNGDVNAYLSRYPESDRMQLVLQVAAGIAYLHNLKVPIIHGDIKSSNILINDENVACLTDFGVSRALECSGFTSIGKGSYRWMAPELFNDESANYNPRITEATDIWAFAMCALEIFSGRVPYVSIKNGGRVILSIAKGVLPEPKDYPGVSDNVWPILRACWQANPTDRPSMRQLLECFDSNATPRSTQALNVDHDILQRCRPRNNHAHWRRFIAPLVPGCNIFRSIYKPVDSETVFSAATTAFYFLQRLLVSCVGNTRTKERVMSS